MPAGNVQKLREHLDAYARGHLTPADFEPQIEFERELPLDEVTPELQQTLSLLEPFGMDNAEPIFTAKAVRLLTPAQVVKDKHVRLRLAPAANGASRPAVVERAPRPSSGEEIVSSGAEMPASATQAASSWRSNIAFKAMGWGLRESCDRLQLLAGDRLDIAYTLGMNDHPEFGGLELTLRDIVRSP